MYGGQRVMVFMALSSLDHLIVLIYPSWVSGDPMRYFAAAVLRSVDAQTSATARLGSVCPGNVAHSVFITNSVCSQDDVMAVSSPSFLTRAASAFSPARQIGTRAAVTAASACLTATWLAVLLVVQPPQLKPTIMVRIPPTTAPQTPGLSHARCACIRPLLVLRRMVERPECRGTLYGPVVDQGPLRSRSARNRLGPKLGAGESGPGPRDWRQSRP